MYKYRFFDIFEFTEMALVLTPTLFILLVVFAIYLAFLLLVSIQWTKIETESTPIKVSVTVVIPFRNEQANLPKLVGALSKQTAENLEVIFVNDSSTDESVEVLQNALADFPFEHRVLNLEMGEGKKAALAYGIENAKSEVVLTTDADCVMEAGWVEQMALTFEAKTQLVSGPVVLTGNSFFQRLQRLEFFSLIGTGGAMVAMGKPTMANGANLAFRKSAFDHVGGYAGSETTPSGDDEFLLYKVQKAFPEGVKFNKSNRAVVVTEAEASWEAFRSQRLRWASKWRLGKRWATIFTAMLVGIVQLAQLVCYLTLVFGWFSAYIVVAALALKALLEFIFLRQISQDLTSKKLPVWLFMASFIIYPFYALYFALVANFGSYQWKGRTY